MCFKYVCHRPNWDTHSPLITSQNAKLKYTKKSHSSEEVPKIYSKKTTAAVCSQSPDVTTVKSQHVLHVIPTRCAWKRNCLENSSFAPSLMCSDNTMIRLTSTKMRNANRRGTGPMQFGRANFQKEKAATEKKTQDQYKSKAQYMISKRKAFKHDVLPFRNYKYISLYTISGINDLYIYQTATWWMFECSLYFFWEHG